MPGPGLGSEANLHYCGRWRVLLGTFLLYDILPRSKHLIEEVYLGLQFQRVHHGGEAW